METVNIIPGTTQNLLLEILLSGVGGVTGETPNVEIQRESDGEYWDGAAWQAGVQVNAMAEYDSTDEPGLYNFSFAFPAGNNTYIVHFTNTGTYALDEYRYYVARAELGDLETDVGNLPTKTQLTNALNRLTRFQKSGITFDDLLT